MTDQQQSGDYQMLFEAIDGRFMTRRERLLWGSAGLLVIAIDLALAVAPIYIYATLGFEPAVIAALFAITIQVSK